MGAMIEPSEAIDLTLVLLALPILVGIVRGRPRTERLLYGFAYGLLAIGRVATIVEGVAIPDVLNIAEHALYAASGILFATAIASRTRKSWRGAR